jgi:acyl carrier protein
VQVVAADISRREDVQGLIHTIQTQGMVLRGIVHAAGVLDDGVLTQQTWERFEKVMAPKVAGTWHLHQLTQDQPLDWFVCFSSMASLIGSPGQSNYAAANAFQDALAHYRHQQEQTGLSINWGPWAEAGMAASLDQQNQDRWGGLGMKTIATEQGLQLLGQLLQDRATQAVVMGVNWQQFQAQLSTIPPFLTGLLASLETQGKAGTEPELLKLLKPATSLTEQREILLSYVKEQVTKVLGLSPTAAIDTNRGFTEMGMDSLMSVELRNRLRVGTGKNISSTLAFDYPTVDALLEYLARDVLQLVETTSATMAKVQTEAAESEADRLADLSEDELAQLLGQELGFS